MAQIEFTAVILTLLARCRIEAVSLPNETNSDLETRLDGRLHDSIHSTLMTNYNFPQHNFVGSLGGCYLCYTYQWFVSALHVLLPWLLEDLVT